MSISKRKDNYNYNKRIETSQNNYDEFQKEKGNKYSYEICLFATLILEFFSMKDYSNVVYHLFQNSIYSIIYVRKFEKNTD